MGGKCLNCRQCVPSASKVQVLVSRGQGEWEGVCWHPRSTNLTYLCWNNLQKQTDTCETASKSKLEVLLANIWGRQAGEEDFSYVNWSGYGDI